MAKRHPQDFTEVTTPDGTEKVPLDGSRFMTTGAIAALGGVDETMQTVTSSPATVAAKFVTIATDDYDSGTPGVLRMPPITEGAMHVISTAFENVYFNVEKHPGDPANTGPNLLIDSAFIRRQAIIMHAAYVDEGGGPELRWQFDANGYYLKLIFEGVTPLFSQVAALEGYGAGAQVISSTSDTIADALDVFITNAGANITVILPDAAAGRRIRLHKANAATTQTISILRSAGDTVGGTTNGNVGNLDIVMTGITGPYRSWDICASAAAPSAAWHVDNGETLAIASLASSVSTNTSDIAALDTRINALEVTGRQVITTSTATILPGTRVVYIDHAAARTDLTLPATPFEPFTIVKRATTGGFGVRLIPNAGTVAIQGLAAGTNFDIGWMTTNASTTTARPAAFVSSSAVTVVDVA